MQPHERRGVNNGLLNFGMSSICSSQCFIAGEQCIFAILILGEVITIKKIFKLIRISTAMRFVEKQKLFIYLYI